MFDSTLEVTHRCDLRCKFCFIWKFEKKKEITAEDYREHFPKFKTEYFSISGGEPFLKEDLAEIVRIIDERCGSPVFSFNTNGQLTQRIVSTIKEIQEFRPEVNVLVSLDGLEETHDYLRGKKGAFRNAIETLKRLKEVEPNDLNVSYTIVPENYDQIYDVYNLAKKLGLSSKLYEVDFIVRFAHPFWEYKYTEEQFEVIEKQLEKIACEEEKKAARIPILHAAFLRSLTKVFKTQKRIIPCMAGIEFIKIDPYGNVFLCSMPYHETKTKRWFEKDSEGRYRFWFGNFLKQPWAEILENGKRIVNEFEPWNCNLCWNHCDVIPSVHI